MKTILEEALAIVDGARQADYGTPLDNHTRTANLWNAYLACSPGEEPKAITPRDVCWLNILQKASRDRHCPKRDNLVDTGGYAENAQRCEPASVPAGGSTSTLFERLCAANAFTDVQQTVMETQREQIAQFFRPNAPVQASNGAMEGDGS